MLLYSFYASASSLDQASPFALPKADTTVHSSAIETPKRDSHPVTRKVPEEYRQRRNPETLTTEEIPYYQKQFLAKCARCHGENGGGEGQSANTLEVPPANFLDRQFMNEITDGEIFYQIEQGGMEKSAMPAFGPDSAQGWSEEKIWHMVAFIRSLLVSASQP